MTASPATIADAVASLADAASAAGLDADQARDQAAALAAAIASGAADAPNEWAEAFGRPTSTFDAAARAGRAWLEQPTDQLTALVMARSPHAARYAQAVASLASAATTLGEPTIAVVAVASVAAQAQLRAAGQNSALPPVLSKVLPSGPASSSPSVAADAPAPAPAAHPPRPLDEVLAELDELVGLSTVKDEIRHQAQVLRVAGLRKAKGLKTPDINRHVVFVGNPGTGKTTIARLVADIYHSMGLLGTGQLIETDRSGLVAGYVGQTAIKTAEVISSAIGGVLFIDEAYALASDDFGHEAIETLLKQMEDHRDELVVIVAGYPRPMARFIAANPGLESRFRLTIDFPDYSDDELVEIFTRNAARSDFVADDHAIAALREILADTVRDEGFGNGRFVRNVFEGAVVRHAWRLRDVADPDVDELRTLTVEDITAEAPPEPGVEAPNVAGPGHAEGSGALPSG